MEVFLNCFVVVVFSFFLICFYLFVCLFKPGAHSISSSELKHLSFLPAQRLPYFETNKKSYLCRKQLSV